jgi:hypothetical protein
MAKQANLIINKATDITYAVRIKNAAKEPIVITDWVIYFSVKINSSDLDSAALINTSVVATTPNATDGLVLIVLTNEMTDIPVGTYKYGIKIKTSLGIITMIAEGEFRVNTSIPKESL